MRKDANGMGRLNAIGSIMGLEEAYAVACECNIVFKVFRSTKFF